MPMLIPVQFDLLTPFNLRVHSVRVDVDLIIMATIENFEPNTLEKNSSEKFFDTHIMTFFKFFDSDFFFFIFFSNFFK